MQDGLKFQIRYDEPQRRLSWAMSGFWNLADVEAFHAAVRSVLRPLGPPPLRFDSLADSRHFPVQSAEVSEALSRIERASAALHDGRVAIVVSSVLNNLQVRRTFNPNVRTFNSLEDATAWLDIQIVS